MKSSTPYTTIWSDIHWIKIEKYVNKLQKRIYLIYLLTLGMDGIPMDGIPLKK
ncbi:MAG: hypothetical protein LBT10_03200 [Methanobrevibacter sp.]|nr:hypothetical protein [Methanobrevibacter sp.]